MFAADFEQAQHDGRRRAPRAPVSFNAGLDGDGGPGGMVRALCKVVDISLHGCRLQTYSALRRGSTIWLNLPEIGPVAAEVKWADDFTAGCQFCAALDRASFEALVARHG